MSPATAFDYRAPAWLRGGHAQTIWSARVARRHDGPYVGHATAAYTRERWTTPDADFIDVDWQDDAAASGDARAAPPLLVLFHGLEGDSSSAYAQAFAGVARQRGWRYAVPHFRGCSGELNLAPRAYHSGDVEEIGFVLGRFRERHAGPIVAVGISMGGNALLRWAAEAGESAARCARAVAAVCSPLDLAASGRAIGRGFSRLVYTRMFLATLKPKAEAKLVQHPGLFDAARLRAARTLYEFDDVVTGPLHGYAGVDDYWARASARPHLARIRIPALALNARNDPFVPADSLPTAQGVAGRVELWQPDEGGHVGFASGPFRGHVLGMPLAVAGWLAARI